MPNRGMTWARKKQTARSRARNNVRLLRIDWLWAGDFKIKEAWDVDLPANPATGAPKISATAQIE